MKGLVIGAVLAFGGIAQAQESAGPGTFGQAWTGNLLASASPAGREELPSADSDFLPRSMLDFREPSPRIGDEAYLTLGAQAGYLKSHGADDGTWLGGVQARLHFLRFLAAEAAISFHQNKFQSGAVRVTQYPLQLTAMLYPFPDGQFQPYILGGVGWYYTRFDYFDALSGLSSKTDNIFGEHLGGGLELKLGQRISIDADIRYIFLNPTNDQVRSRDFNYWQATFGLNLFF